LIDKGASFDLEDKHLYTALERAATSGDVDCMRSLLAAGARATRLDSCGSTLLHVLLSHGHFNQSLIRLAVACGTDVNRRDNDSRVTATHFAAEANNTKCLATLFAIGAKFRTRSTALEPTTLAMLVSGGFNRTKNPNPVLQSLQTAVATARTAGQDADEDQLKSERELLAAARLQLVRARGCEVCIGLQSLQLHALRLAEIIRYSSWPAGDFMPFHVLWGIATKVKHFPTSLNEN
jgi:ankyrin repeat protein